MSATKVIEGDSPMVKFGSTIKNLVLVSGFWFLVFWCFLYSGFLVSHAFWFSGVSYDFILKIFRSTTEERLYEFKKACCGRCFHISKVTKVMARMASADMMCVGPKFIPEKFTGIIRCIQRALSIRM
ncbi:Uncharacterized protein Fot_06101 [Forsythia ovata]|uniref:Uncharacterized protein n=1 Tax=Forsythia ovata TaxID=205694 RepID=A0ABD1WSC6_9LAMI